MNKKDKDREEWRNEFISMEECPCNKCLINSTCTISFVDNTVCKPFLEFICKLLGVKK